MRRAKSICFLMGFSLIALCGCQSDTEPNIKSSKIADVTPGIEATSAPTKSPVAEKKQPPLTTGKYYKLYDGKKVVMSVRVNQVQKVRITDWTNHEALANGIAACYSFNCSVRYEDKTAEADTIKIMPAMMCGANVASEVADVGWTGFNTYIDYYNGAKAVNECEVTVQPTVQNSDVSGIVLQVSNNKKSWTIPCSKKMLKTAVTGPKVREAGDVVRAKAPNGAKFSFTMDRVWIAESDSLYANSAAEGPVFHVHYRLALDSGTTNHVAVKDFQGAGKKTKMKGKMVMALQPQGVNQLLYKSLPEARRRNERTGEYERYVTEDYAVAVGYTLKGVTNREITADVNQSVAYVRLRPEFPEEFKSMSLKQKLKSNLRFCVYELSLQ